MIRIEVTEAQSRLIIKALDLYSRIGTGQFSEILDHPTIDNFLMESCTPKKGKLEMGDRTMRGEVVEIGDGYVKTKGSWGNGAEVRKWEDVDKIKRSPDWEQLHGKEDAIKTMFNAIKDTIGMKNWGIHNSKVDNSCRVSYDILQVIRHELWKQNIDKQYMTVDSSVHLTSGKDSEKIKCETI